MKILVCATEYYPHGSGIANVAYNVVENLKKQNVECTICSPSGPDIKLGSSKALGVFGLIYYWLEVSRYFKKNDGSSFDAVWLHNPLFISSFPFDSAVVTMNATYYGQSQKKMYNFYLHFYKKITSYIEKFSLKKIKAKSVFTGVGSNICEELEHIGINRDRMQYIPNGVDCSKFKPTFDKIDLRTKFNIPHSSTIMLSVGRLSDQKDPFSLLSTFIYVSDDIKDLTLVISGRGPHLKKLKEIVTNENIENVIFLGYIDEKDKADLYACADYFIIASKYEGGEPPLTLAEALASGLPCIASDISNFRFVGENQCGIIVNFTDTSKASKKIIGYLGNKNGIHEKNAEQFAKENLDWNIISREYLSLFENI